MTMQMSINFENEGEAKKQKNIFNFLPDSFSFKS